MSYQEQIKRIYTEANGLLTQARGIMAEYEGKTIPAEKQTQIDTLLDQVEGKEKEGKRLERLMDAESRFNEPATNLPLGSGGPGAGGGNGNGALKTPVLSAAVKNLAQIAGYDEKRVRPAPLTLEDGTAYDPDRTIKHAIATALLWKYGKDLDEALNRLPKEFAPLRPELKDLATAPGGSGGYLVADTLRGELIEILDDMTTMRRLARVLPSIPGGSAITPSEDSDLSDATWTHEVATGADDTVAPFGNRQLTPHPIAKRIKISRTLLRAATLLNVESWVLRRLARKFSYAEENAFINGTGAQQPLGILTAAGISSTTTATSNVLAGDDIINWVYSLDAKYQRNAAILCNQAFLRKVRLLRDASGGAGTGQYLWQPGLQQGKPGIILDFPYEMSDFYPTGLDGSDAYEDNALVATIGNWEYYWIADSLMFTVQRLDELYAESNQVGFIGRKETDGMPVKTEAFRHLKIKA